MYTTSNYSFVVFFIAEYLIMAFVGIIMSCLGYLTYLFSPIDHIVDSVSALNGIKLRLKCLKITFVS